MPIPVDAALPEDDADLTVCDFSVAPGLLALVKVLFFLTTGLFVTDFAFAAMVELRWKVEMDGMCCYGSVVATFYLESTTSLICGELERQADLDAFGFLFFALLCCRERGGENLVGFSCPQDSVRAPARR